MSTYEEFGELFALEFNSILNEFLETEGLTGMSEVGKRRVAMVRIQEHIRFNPTSRDADSTHNRLRCDLLPQPWVSLFRSKTTGLTTHSTHSSSRLPGCSDAAHD